MKHIKFPLPFFALIIGILGAFASKPKQACTMEPQYYYNGFTYLSAGTLGQDYICVNGNGFCTYISAGSSFIPCQSGVYTPLKLKVTKK
jgi:hypothetical protein